MFYALNENLLDYDSSKFYNVRSITKFTNNMLDEHRIRHMSFSNKRVTYLTNLIEADSRVDKLIKSAIEDRKELTLFYEQGVIEKSYVQKMRRNGTTATFNRKYKDGSFENGEYTVHMMLLSELLETLTLIDFVLNHNIKCCFNTEGSHSNSNKAINSDCDFIFWDKNDVKYYVELQETYYVTKHITTKDNIKSNFNNIILNSYGKYYKMLRHIKNNENVLFIQKFTDIYSLETVYVVYNMNKVLTQSLDSYRVTKDNVLPLYEAGKITTQEYMKFYRLREKDIYVANSIDNAYFEVVDSEHRLRLDQFKTV